LKKCELTTITLLLSQRTHLANRHCYSASRPYVSCPVYQIRICANDCALLAIGNFHWYLALHAYHLLNFWCPLCPIFYSVLWFPFGCYWSNLSMILIAFNSFVLLRGVRLICSRQLKWNRWKSLPGSVNLVWITFICCCQGATRFALFLRGLDLWLQNLSWID
jgi:hypothetical protein